jgi:hypothetical protein
MLKTYPELRECAEEIANLTAFAINQAASRTESEMPYKAQFILETVIELLQNRV